MRKWTNGWSSKIAAGASDAHQQNTANIRIISICGTQLHRDSKTQHRKLGWPAIPIVSAAKKRSKFHKTARQCDHSLHPIIARVGLNKRSSYA